MFEDVGGLRRNPVPQQQPGLDQAIERRIQLRLILLRHVREQCVGELLSDGRSHLDDIPRCAEPVEPRQQRGVQARRKRGRHVGGEGASRRRALVRRLQAWPS